MILYEYPFNEPLRTYLRREHLFGRLGQLLPRDSALDHHYALITIFEVMDVTSRADLKSEVLKDLDKQKAHMGAFRGNPAISEASLDAFLDENLGGDLFYREMRGIDVGDVFLAEQVLHLAHFELALGEAGIAAVGFAFVANRRQPVGVDG